MTEGTIASDLAAVAAAVGAVSKDRDADAGAGGSYKFRGIDDVMNAVHPAFAEHGVTILMEDVAVSYDTIERGNRGAKWRHWLVTTDYHFIARDGSALKCRVTSEALDNQDKGIGKAHSYGLKDALCRLLTLPTNDPHADNEANAIPDAAGPEMVPKAKAKGELVGALHGDTAKAAELWPFGDSRWVSREDLDDLLAQVKTSPPGEGEQTTKENASTANAPSDLGDRSPVPDGTLASEEGAGQPDTAPSDGDNPARAIRDQLKGKR